MNITGDKINYNAKKKVIDFLNKMYYVILPSHSFSRDAYKRLQLFNNNNKKNFENDTSDFTSIEYRKK